MRSDSSSPPQETSSSSDAEDYPVWKRWGELDEHSKARPVPAERAEEEPSPAEALRRVAEAKEARMREAAAREGVAEDVGDVAVDLDEAAEDVDEVAEDADEIHDVAGDLDQFHEAAEDVHQAAEDPRSWESDFSALDIRDRVVIMLLFKQVVQIDEVEAAWRRFQSTNHGRSREPLWRILARDPALDRDRILAEAARTAGFETADVDPAQATRFIDACFRSFSESDWERMLGLSVVPVGREKDPRSGRERVVFIAPDPSRPGVAKLLRDLEIDGHVLRYAPERLIDSLLADLTGIESADAISPSPKPEHQAPESAESRDRGDRARESANGAAPADAANDETAPLEPAPRTLRDATPGIDETEADEDSAPEEETAIRPQLETSNASPDEEARELFEECLTGAVKRGATDVHLLTVDDGVRIDMRVKGELERWRTCPMPLGDQLLAVVKESAMNIMPSEIDSVQDGTIKRKLGDVTAHFRVSVLPIAGGWSEDRRESVVISMLGDGSPVKDLQSLGLPEEALRHLREAIAETRGMVILAGPSGSGRSTTLSAILHEIVTPKVNVITLEESVNHDIPDVRQVRLSHKLDHEDALEAVRRHDPDIILVGELRTKETAELALKLANAGHLVFSRVPAHDTTGVISRLFKLSVDPFLIAYAINLVVAQRLVRRLCPDCRQPARHVDGELLRRLGFSRQEIASTTFYDEAGGKECPSCGGRRFLGNAIIAEAMPFTHDTRRLIALADASFDEEDVRTQAVREGMTTIRAAARDVVIRGETSIGELIRATAGEH